MLAHIPPSTYPNLYMEPFEQLALSAAPQPPLLWLHYVNDTFTVLNEYDLDEFTEHISNIDPHIKFTIELEKHQELPFLDLCMHILNDTSRKITTSIYMKPTHTDRYHRPKLTNTAQQYFTTAEDRKAELAHVHNALRANDYLELALEVPPPSEKLSGVGP